MSSIGFRFEHTYQKLPALFFSHQAPTPVAQPHLVLFNHALAAELGLHTHQLDAHHVAAILAGNIFDDGAQPIAQAYAGHQFGHFNRLGDGRAILLGEHRTSNGSLVDIQLKGAGRTPYSRRGDGRAAIGPMLREYLISEAMDALGIPSTRSLAVVTTGESVRRDGLLPGAILTRIAQSHIRFGTFEYAAAFASFEEGQQLLHYAINRHYPHIPIDDLAAITFFDAVIQKHIQLMIHWMRVGFIHGVMNTDNMSIAGETIDYGPCAFMDTYDPYTVFSSIDTGGRYAYFQQPRILQWNLARLADALPISKKGDQMSQLSALTEQVGTGLNSAWQTMMAHKIGIEKADTEDQTLILDLLQWMHTHQADYTNTFLVLSEQLPSESVYQIPSFLDWKNRWYACLKKHNISLPHAYNLMKKVNPCIIPRNHLVEKALFEAARGDFTFFLELVDVLQHPYTMPNKALYQTPPTEKEKVTATFCGT